MSTSRNQLPRSVARAPKRDAEQIPSSSSANSSDFSHRKHVPKKRRLLHSLLASSPVVVALKESRNPATRDAHETPLQPDSLRNTVPTEYEFSDSPPGDSVLEEVKLVEPEKESRLHRAESLDTNTSRAHRELKKSETPVIRDTERNAAHLSSSGGWTPTTLQSFQNTSVEKISLASSTSPSNPASELLFVFFKQGAFQSLSHLTLSNIPLTLLDISHLRLLPSLQTLNLASTSLTPVHLLHLAPHAPTLRNLDISSNPSIIDSSLLPLSALTNLTSLRLRSTNLTMTCLRLLIYNIPSTCRLMTVPQSCLDVLNHRELHYCAAIPRNQGYVSDPRVVPDMTVEALKRNLQLHKRANGDVSLTGSKIELVERIRSILCHRVADERLIKRIGRP